MRLRFVSCGLRTGGLRTGGWSGDHDPGSSQKLRRGIFQIVDEIAAGTAGVIRHIAGIDLRQARAVASKQRGCVGNTQLAQEKIRVIGERWLHTNKRLHKMKPMTLFL